MKIRNINILTDQQLNDHTEKSVKSSLRINSKFMAERVIPELQRLKADHWDKDAFDRLINFFKDLQNAKN